MTTLSKPTARAASTLSHSRHAVGFRRVRRQRHQAHGRLSPRLSSIILLTPVWIIVARWCAYDGGPALFKQESRGRQLYV